MTLPLHRVLLATTFVASSMLTGTWDAKAQSVVPTSATIARSQSVLPEFPKAVSGRIGTEFNTAFGGITTVVQISPTAIINWQSFSIGQNNSFSIKQPNAQSVLLNRVTGSTRSIIAGTLDANGQVYLVNPNGIGIAPTGKVTAGGGFVASTLDISDDDFNAGRRQFRSTPYSNIVGNDGTITVGRGGYAALIGRSVGSSGTITAPMGKVGLGAGESVTLDLSGDGFLQVAFNGPYAAVGIWDKYVINSGLISAEGGTVKLAAASARALSRGIVSLTGTIEARSVSGRNGNIILSASSDGSGRVYSASGSLIDASGGMSGENGGPVAIGGSAVWLDGKVDVSGAKGGLALVTSSEALKVSGTVRATGEGGRIGLFGGNGTISLDPSTKLETSASGKVEIRANTVSFTSDRD